MESFKLYQWKEYGHDSIADKRREKENSQNTWASCKSIKKRNLVEDVMNLGTNKVKTNKIYDLLIIVVRDKPRESKRIVFYAKSIRDYKGWDRKWNEASDKLIYYQNQQKMPSLFRRSPAFCRDPLQ